MVMIIADTISNTLRPVRSTVDKAKAVAMICIILTRAAARFDDILLDDFWKGRKYVFNIWEKIRPFAPQISPPSRR